ncbi:hypothetical protein [Ramlibacter sp. 2FC]|uniref:hypothetical protein n=1 Tax=Ramlibacter sp. 2FC TaxID=2502188 RepID=UPI0010F63ADC|nr:hypothetical protein [Ramlibacter sp. 2FC]
MVTTVLHPGQSSSGVTPCFFRNGHQFRLHACGLPGSPGIVLPRFRTIVFVQGCVASRAASVWRLRLQSWSDRPSSSSAIPCIMIAAMSPASPMGPSMRK